MADLDDFFAKKDRKKSKGKKFATTDEIAKKLEETGKKIEKPKKEKPVQAPQVPGQEGEEPVIQPPEDDEWKDFEEEKKDYTGLKIGNLQIVEGQGDDAGDDDVEEEENEAGEMVPRKKVVAGPWKMMNAQSEAAPTPPPPVERPKRAESGSVQNSSYVPPYLRDGGRPKEMPVGNSRLKNKAAPDINNQDFFPTLSAAKTAEPAGAWGKKKKSQSQNPSRSTASLTEIKLPSSPRYQACTNWLGHNAVQDNSQSDNYHSSELGSSPRFRKTSLPESFRPYSHEEERIEESERDDARPGIYRPPCYRPLTLHSYSRNTTSEDNYSSSKSWRRDEGTFEEVRNKSHHRGYADVATKLAAVGTGPKLNLGNKYDALEDQPHDQS